MLVLFLPLFLILLLIGLPVFFATLFAPGAMMLALDMDRDLPLLFRNIYNGIDSFPLMAIPFFMLAGELMNRGGITLQLVNFSQAFIGHVRGGLAHVNIMSSMLFAGLSGSAVADTSALGSMLIPAMEKNGYSRRFAAAITAASSVIGPIIPPSGIMIIYAYTMEVSVAALFAAGIVPGILIGLALMGVTSLMAKKHDFPVASQKATWSERGQATRAAILPLLTPVIILGGIVGGIFTPTEASAIAVGYALFLSLFMLKTIKTSELPEIFARSASSSAVVLLLVGSALAFKTVVSLSHAAEDLAGWVLGVSENPLILLFAINILLFIVGMFLDAGPAIIILGPILAPIFISIGIDPVHFAIIMSVNLTVGLATPPMGLVLFVASSVSGERVESIAKGILPFLAVEILVIFLITFFPSVSMTIPKLLGLVH
ncbi:putative TRAP-type C4-dicarboxylate transport system, large permease component DctM [Vibrio nigripulchritudo MADA3029]|uniref:TRAP transporter large permease n=1 Tax=Vibrio nigripulchritudo TaxID=28173 RepID=UPI0003B23DF1|nr:TRAP transporter large permease [Vibrio nigripulchritudo]CCN49977.1 putative TRAP-type C4-dicarboxylate transport system, large permease component DctM [Vibrio nigripulchritudo MADA3020]CCN53175.1 putative TRAP-type C4-dicarboxylate transport system, large permease component DctM [Vibrio nigripulchritudo MADA3021]CCN58535.1 putative TRAP-type C4-dicarboxylate transport system, large permease component DctM [Vibrio nigripulchritudo MADA3029]